MIGVEIKKVYSDDSSRTEVKNFKNTKELTSMLYKIPGNYSRKRAGRNDTERVYKSLLEYLRLYVGVFHMR